MFDIDHCFSSRPNVYFYIIAVCTGTGVENIDVVQHVLSVLIILPVQTK